MKVHTGMDADVKMTAFLPISLSFFLMRQRIQQTRSIGMHAAKFLPPRPVPILHRDRLANRLLLWEDKKLVLIQAQAGQGKSTLAAAYARALTTPFVWYNLDREDENPDLFLTCLGHALQKAFPDQLHRIPPAPQNSLVPVSFREGIRRWLEQVFTPLIRPCLLVFDDLHAATSSPGLIQILKMLLEETPAHIRIVILSRTRPGLDIAALRAKQAVGEITGSDLRFSDREVHDLFSSVFDMPLGRNETAMISRNTEGWPAGLVLMHEYLSSLPPGSWPEALKHPGDSRFHQHIFDYLAQEVFSHLPGDLQQFLLTTSITDYLPFPLIRKLCALRKNKSPRLPPEAALQQLKAGNLFVNGLDDAGSVIRYHALFREFLQKKLHAAISPSEIRRLYSTAAGFFWKSGDRIRAIDLLLASGQHERALHGIEECMPGMIAAGRTSTTLRWQEALPEKHRRNAWFLLSRAVSCRFTDSQTALALFDLARRRFRTSPVSRQRASGQALALCGLIESCFHSGGDFVRMERSAAQAGVLLEQTRRATSALQQGRLLLAMGMAWFFTGRLRESTSALLKALDLFAARKDHFYQITSAIYLAPCALYQGDFRTAREALRRGFQAQAAIPEEMGGKAALFLTTAMTALFEGDFREAQENIDQCKNLAEVHALHSIGFLSLDIQGWLKMAQGDYEEAERLLAECKHRGRQAGNAFFTASAAHLLAITCLFQNRLDRAQSESDYALSIRSQAGSKLFHAIYRIAAGAILLERGKPGLAERELLASLRMLHKVGAGQQEANAHLMLALLYERLGKRASWLRHLEAGFSLGQERGFTYYALLTPAELSRLADKAMAEGICSGYCASLLNGGAAGRAAPVLSVQSMGGFKVFRGKRPIRDAEWKSRRAKMLLKLLVAHDGQKLPKERVVEMLWPEKGPEDKHLLFNSMLHRARKALEPKPKPGCDIFCTYRDGDLIALNSDRVWTDVRQFRMHLLQAARLKAAGRSPELLREYEHMIELYKGDFLPEDVYVDWSAGVRESLRADYLRVLGDAGTLAESLGEQGKALQFYEKMFLADSCSEKACRWLMARYLAAGQRSAAIRCYERCERALSRDMDLEPEEKTRKLYRSIIGG